MSVPESELAHLYNNEIHKLGLRLLQLQERIDKAKAILERLDAAGGYGWQDVRPALEALEGK